MKKRFLYSPTDGGSSVPAQGPQQDMTAMRTDGMEKQTPSGRRPQTFGEKMAGVSFNPSKSPSVDEVKHSAAAFIDRIEEAQHRMDLMDATQHALFEQSKILALQAQMMAVKAITWNG